MIAIDAMCSYWTVENNVKAFNPQIGKTSMNNVLNPQTRAEQKKPLNVGIAILVGQLIVNLPVMLIIVGVFSVGMVLLLVLEARVPSLPGWTFLVGVMASIVIGSLAGWLWWSFSVPRWRKWALQNGVPEDKLQKWAVTAGLVWPKGSVFEKTEFRIKE
jgi:hypothetical protein